MIFRKYSFMNFYFIFVYVQKNIIEEIQKYLSFGHYEWNKGYVSGAVYTGNDEKLSELMRDVYGLTAYTNPLHPDIFPGIRIMEAEIIQMVSSLFHAPRSVGTVSKHLINLFIFPF